VTWTVASPRAPAVAAPFDVTASTDGLELIHNGAGPDGGTPEPSSTLTENCWVSQRFKTFVAGTIAIALTAATAVVLAGFGETVGALGMRSQAVEPSISRIIPTTTRG
jgi:hypothetical protein